MGETEDIETGGETGTVGETLFRRIRRDIISGDLKPGQKLTLDRLRDQYGAEVNDRALPLVIEEMGRLRAAMPADAPAADSAPVPD